MFRRDTMSRSVGRRSTSRSPNSTLLRAGGGTLAGVGLALAILVQSVSAAGPLLRLGAGFGATVRSGLAGHSAAPPPAPVHRAGQLVPVGPGDRAPADGEASGSPPRAVGCGFHGLWSIYDDVRRASVLDRLREAGVRSVRIDLSWVMLQPDGPTSYYPWGVALVDHVIEMANERGIAPLMTLWLTPPWANGGAGERALPDHPADYARVAGWAAARWRGKVVGWEVWNEPNSPAFLHGADPAGYVRLLRAAYPAIKAVAPEAPVVLGGLEYNDTDWLARAYAAGAGGAFDVLATHPYQGIADLEPSAVDGTKWTLRHAAAVHRLMASRGDRAKSIWFTEFGWSTHGDASDLNWLQGVSEPRQAAYLAEAATLVGRDMPYVTRIYWSTDRDLSTGDIQYRNYGLFRRDLSAKPALWTLAEVNAAAGAG
jgi:hypothetical protein